MEEIIKKIINDFLNMIGYSVLCIILVMCTIAILLKFRKNICKKINKFIECMSGKEKEEKSISNILENLSMNEHKKKQVRNYVEKLSNKDSKDVLDNLKKKQLVELFSIRANIVEHFNSLKVYDNDLLKYIGFVIVFIGGLFSSAYAGVYSGIVAGLFSGAKLKEKTYDPSQGDKALSDFEKNIASDVNNVKEIITLDSLLPPIIFVIIIFVFIMVCRILEERYRKFNNKTILLLDLVNYAIEFRKEEEMMENKNQPTAVVEEETENETLKNLTTDLLDAKSTNVLLKGLDDKMEYDTIKQDISNYKLPELYPLKANLKNALDKGKYAYSIIFQYIAVVASFVTGLIVKDQPFCLIVIAFLIISVFFLLITKGMVTDKNDVKKIFLLEIVEEEIESKKNSNK